MLEKMLGNVIKEKAAARLFGGVILSFLFSMSLPVWGQGKSAQMIYEPGEQIISASHPPVGNAAYKYEGNLFSRKFHQPNCPYTLVMSPSRKVYFGARKLAQAEGYKACRFCLPLSSRTVHACLIKKEENQAEQ